VRQTRNLSANFWSQVDFTTHYASSALESASSAKRWNVERAEKADKLKTEVNIAHNTNCDN